MIKKTRFMGLALAAIMLCTGLWGTSLAEERMSAGPIGFTAQAVFPENQLDGAGYFHLLALPASSQTIYVAVQNHTDAELRVHLGIHDAYTNAGGAISYTQDGGDILLLGNVPSITGIANIRFDLLAENKMEGILDVKDDTITLAPGARVKVPVAIKLPKEPLEGHLLGGIVITKVDDEKESAEGAFAVRSIYRYAIALMLQAKEHITVAPDFSLGGVQLAETAGFPGLLVTLSNNAPLVVTNASMQMQVLARGGAQALADWAVDNIAMAPDSAMNYALSLPEDVTLPEGDYTARIAWTYGGQTWTMEKDFAVPAAADGQ